MWGGSFITCLWNSQAKKARAGVVASYITDPTSSLKTEAKYWVLWDIGEQAILSANVSQISTVIVSHCCVSVVPENFPNSTATVKGRVHSSTLVDDLLITCHLLSVGG